MFQLFVVGARFESNYYQDSFLELVEITAEMVKLATLFFAVALCQLTGVSSAVSLSNGSVYLDPNRSAKERADDLVRLMTWEEKVGQLGGIRRLAETVNGKLSFNETSFEEIRKTQNGQIGSSMSCPSYSCLSLKHPRFRRASELCTRTFANCQQGPH